MYYALVDVQVGGNLEGDLLSSGLGGIGMAPGDECLDGRASVLLRDRRHLRRKRHRSEGHLGLGLGSNGRDAFFSSSSPVCCSWTSRGRTASSPFPSPSSDTRPSSSERPGGSQSPGNRRRNRWIRCGFVVGSGARIAGFVVGSGAGAGRGVPARGHLTHRLGCDYAVTLRRHQIHC